MKYRGDRRRADEPDIELKWGDEARLRRSPALEVLVVAVRERVELVEAEPAADCAAVQDVFDVELLAQESVLPPALSRC